MLHYMGMNVVKEDISRYNLVSVLSILSALGFEDIVWQGFCMTSISMLNAHFNPSRVTVYDNLVKWLRRVT